MASETDTTQGTPSFVLRRLVTREVLKAKSGIGELQNRAFIEHPVLPNTQVLGPAFLDLPLDLTTCYPILEGSNIVKDRSVSFSKWIKKIFVCWPNYDDKWEDWTIRIFKAKRNDFEDVGLAHVISLLQNGILQNPTLIHASLAFWDPSLNCFRFNCGMMAPTILDVVFFTGFPPYGSAFDITTTNDIPFLSEIRYTQTHASYGNFLDAERKFGEEVSSKEFFAYIWYTLCKMIFCNGGKKMMLDNHAKPLAYNLGGPLWFLQLWLLAYFPDHKVAERWLADIGPLVHIQLCVEEEDPEFAEGARYRKLCPKMVKLCTRSCELKAAYEFVDSTIDYMCAEVEKMFLEKGDSIDAEIKQLDVVDPKQVNGLKKGVNLRKHTRRSRKRKNVISKSTRPGQATVAES